MNQAKRLLLFALFLLLPALNAQQVQLSNTQREALTGQFRNPSEPDTTYNLFNRNGQLQLETETMPPTPLRALSTTLLQSEPGNYYHFELDNKSQAIALDLEEEKLPRIGPPVAHTFLNYTREEFMIPMRDGTRLHTVLLRPVGIATPLPFLIQRTPYGVDGTTMQSFHMGRPQLAQEGYLYVAQDIRGRFTSEGQFVMMRPLANHKNPKAIDESTDASDTAEWLVAHIPGNNGRVGFIGTSYPGFLAMMAGIDPSPVIKAVSPQAPMIDVWLGDDFFHNGAFRQSYGHDYTLAMERTKENGDVSYGKGVDGYDYFLQAGSFAAAAKKSGSPKLPTFKGFLDHPTYDQYWQARGVAQWLTRVAVPTLTVGGYYDQEDMYGPQEEYKRLEAADEASGTHKNFFVLGPWRHGSWAATTRHLGALQYGEPIGKEFREQIEAPFFAFYLKDKPGFDLKNTASYQTGSNKWMRYDHFPPTGAHTIALDLMANHTIMFPYLCKSGSPGAYFRYGDRASGKVDWVSDPANPVPYRERPIQPTYGEGSQWYNWLVADQSFATDRQDVAMWQGSLNFDLTVSGEVTADIFASTTGTDADWIVKLIDQYPKDDPDPTMRGYQLITNAEIFRARYRDGFDKPTPLEPNKPYEYKFSLHNIDHVFKKGHTIVVEIQSTWFPLYDRNPQIFVPNIMEARPKDYQKTTQSIWQGRYSSKLTLPVTAPAEYLNDLDQKCHVTI
jgi:hypothetical protein